MKSDETLLSYVPIKSTNEPLSLTFQKNVVGSNIPLEMFYRSLNSNTYVMRF